MQPLQAVVGQGEHSLVTALKEQARQLQLAEPIKALGSHQVPVKLHSDVQFPITVDVVSA